MTKQTVDQLRVAWGDAIAIENAHLHTENARLRERLRRVLDGDDIDAENVRLWAFVAAVEDYDRCRTLDADSWDDKNSCAEERQTMRDAYAALKPEDAGEKT